jgi:S1-C subfamily serine protease
MAMTSLGDWQIAPARQPKPGDYRFNLERALASVVALRAIIPADAFTAETLGVERAGNGVVIRDGVVLTIGYLITEAEEIWLILADGSVVPGHALAYDQVTGFGLVQALGKLEAPVLPLGRSGATPVGAPVVMAAIGGRRHAVAAEIVAKQEFAGYWEYVLDEAIFIAPAHPFWGGAALIGESGELIGIGSLQVEQRSGSDETAQMNMVAPIDLLKPILPDLLTKGRAERPPRPWLGLFATELEEKVFVAGVSTGAPAEKAGLRPTDMIAAVAGKPVSTLAGLFRSIWALGTAGVDVPLTIHREGRGMAVNVKSADRDDFLKKPRLNA